MQINSLHRDSSGVATLVWTLTNTGGKESVIGPALSKWGSMQFRGNSTSGAALVDSAAKLSYSPLRDSDGVCMCTSFILLDAANILQPNQSVTLSDSYQLPADLTSVDIALSYFARTTAIKNVPIK